MELFLLVLGLVSAGTSELLIAVPDSSRPEDQTFQALFIKNPISDPAPTQFPTFNFIQTESSQNQAQFLEEYFPQTTAHSKSFSMFQEPQLNAPLIRTDKSGSGVTITIKVKPEEFNRHQAQGSNIQNTYAQTSTLKSILEQGSSIADALKSGILIATPSPRAQASSHQNTVTDTSIFQSNGFLKSVKNLIQSQFSSLMDSSTSPRPLQSLQSQHYPQFVPTPTTQPQNQLKPSILNFLAQNNVVTQNSNPAQSQSNPQIQIAKPQNNAISLGTEATGDENSVMSPVSF